MAKLKGKGVVLAGLVAGVLSFLSKKENRDKAMTYLDQLKKEANNFSSSSTSNSSSTSSDANSSSQMGSVNIQQKVNEFMKATQDTTATKDSTGTTEGKIASFMAMSPEAKEKPGKETLEDIAATAAQSANSVLEGNHMIDEGAQTTVNYYNGEQQDQQDQQDLR